MKFLQMEAIREEQKRDSEAEMKKLVRKSMPIQNAITSEEFMTDPSQDKWKRHTVLSNDSGYSTTDSLEKIGWSPNVSEELNRQKVEYERRKKTAEQLRIQQEEEEKEQRRKAAQRIQEEQKAMLERQWQESQANDAARAEESRGLDKKQEEPRPEVPRADPEANRGEDEARRSVQNKNPTQTPATTTTTNSTNKEEQKPSNVPLRRQGSDSRQSNPTSNPPPSSTGKSVGAKQGPWLHVANQNTH